MLTLLIHYISFNYLDPITLSTYWKQSFHLSTNQATVHGFGTIFLHTAWLTFV